MLVQNMFRNLGFEEGKSFLEEALGITVKDYGNYMMLNYSMINSPKHDPIVKECRSLILDKNNDYRVLARAFDRFLNYGEDPNTEDFKIEDSISYEKVDGSLVLLWFNPYTGEWTWSTRKMAHAEGETRLGGKTFHELIMETVTEEGFKDIVDHINKLNKYISYTYIFELVSTETRVVVQYGENKLYYLGSRANEYGTEFIPDCEEYENISGKFSVSFLVDSLHKKYPYLKNKIVLPKLHKFKTFEDIVSNFPKNVVLLESRDPEKRHSKEDLFQNCLNVVDTKINMKEIEEGYVCISKRDNNTLWRLKIKNPTYLAYAHIRENGILSEKKIAYFVMSNEYGEYLSIYPEDKGFFDPYIEAREKLFSEIDKQWNKFKFIDDKKEYALRVKDLRISGILFKLKSGKTLEEIVNEWLDPKTPKYDLMLDLLNYFKS